MIHFSWTRKNENRFHIEIKTPVTRIGTLYRLTTAIYIFNFNVISGSIDTISENDVLYSLDEFVLETEASLDESAGASNLDGGAHLGALMENLLREEMQPEKVLEEKGIKPSSGRSFFEAAPELVFQDHPEKNYTEMYIETLGRRGLLYHLTRILNDEGVNILRAKIHTHPSGIAEDVFSLEQEGRSLGRDLCSRLEERIRN